MKIKSTIIFYTFILLILFSLPVNASGIKIDTFSMPIKTANRIFQPLNISLSTDGAWKVFVESLDSQIRNQDNPNYSIPLTRLELTETSGSPIANFDTGKIIEINNISAVSMNNLNLALNLVSFDCDRPGNYLLDIKFSLRDESSNISECVYTFRFDKEEISSIDFSQPTVRLSIDKEKILHKNSSQNLKTPLGLYVSSNKDWKLYVRKTSDVNNANIKTFVKVIGGDNSINCNMTNDYIPIENNLILLASGKATINNNINTLDKKIINIDYLIKGPEDRFIPAGSQTEEFEYRLETED